MIRPRCPVPFCGSASPRKKLPRTSKQNFNPKRLDDPLTVLSGVGPATARAAATLGLFTIRDLLFHFPFRHEDYTSHRRIGELKWDEEATVSCCLESISRRPTRRRNLRLVVATVGDDTGYMEALWFNQDYLADQLTAGDRLLLRGRYYGGSRTFRVKGHELLGKQGAGLHTTGFVPVYETTARISVKRLRGWLGQCIQLAARMADPLPAGVRDGLRLPWKSDAVIAMHFPRTPADYATARRRLVFEELYLMQLGLLSHRQAYERERRGVRLRPSGELTRRFIEGLPFRLT
ncbi:MAG TPA: hypothetical protein ENH44_01520, partial [Actinobacteria bacterium]|nr:hypothetical protein [Actinomycetota bacterium]